MDKRLHGFFDEDDCYRYKSLAAFQRDWTSSTEAAVVWRELENSCASMQEFTHKKNNLTIGLTNGFRWCILFLTIPSEGGRCHDTTWTHFKDSSY